MDYYEVAVTITGNVFAFIQVSKFQLLDNSAKAQILFSTEHLLVSFRSLTVHFRLSSHLFYMLVMFNIPDTCIKLSALEQAVARRRTMQFQFVRLRYGTVQMMYFKMGM